MRLKTSSIMPVINFLTGVHCGDCILCECRMFDPFKFNHFFPATYIFAFTGNNRKVPADVAKHTQNIVLKPISPNGTQT
jgi:hypothetical protein